MGLFIKIEKFESHEFGEVLAQITPFCEGVEYKEDAVWCFPSGGKLLHVVQFLTESNLTFELQIEPNNEM